VPPKQLVYLPLNDPPDEATVPKTSFQGCIMDVTIRFSEVLHAAARVGFAHSGYAVELASDAIERRLPPLINDQDGITSVLQAAHIR
jgi:hypothetical protein